MPCHQERFILRSFPAFIAASVRANPSAVRGPVDNPPCILQRLLRGLPFSLFQTARALQLPPDRVLAPHRGRSDLVVVIY